MVDESFSTYFAVHTDFFSVGILMQNKITYVYSVIVTAFDRASDANVGMSFHMYVVFTCPYKSFAACYTSMFDHLCMYRGVVI